MELLLTSSGIANTSIRDALLGLLGKPIEESSALVIPTAIYPVSGGAGDLAGPGAGEQRDSKQRPSSELTPIYSPRS